jgi:hypothetical protein
MVSPLFECIAHLGLVLVMIVGLARATVGHVIEQQIANVLRNFQLGQFGFGNMPTAMQEEVFVGTGFDDRLGEARAIDVDPTAAIEIRPTSGFSL